MKDQKPSELTNIKSVSTSVNAQYQMEVNKLTNFQDSSEALAFSKHLILSGVLPKAYTKPETVLLAMQMGKEIGLNAVSSIFGIDIIQDKPALSGKLMASLVWASGCAIKTVKDFEPIYSEGENPEIIDYQTVIKFYRPYLNGILLEEDVKFLWSEAAQLGHTKKDQWSKQPGVMMWWRALSKGCRRMIPDKMAGLYHSHEIADTSGLSYELTEDGEIRYI